MRRGYHTPAEARAFLEAADAHDPFAFDGMDEVVERIRAAVAGGGRITIHGDYDVDGTAATAICVRALRELGADVDWYIPSRLEDGYGFTASPRWPATSTSSPGTALNPEVLADLLLDTARLQRLVDDLLALEREAASAGPVEPGRLDEIVARAAAEHPSVRVGRSSR